MKQPVEVEIMGQRLTVASDDGADHVRAVAMLVDEKMRKLADAYNGAPLLHLALLTALNLGSDYSKLSEDQERLDLSISKLSQQVDAGLRR